MKSHHKTATTSALITGEVYARVRRASRLVRIALLCSTSYLPLTGHAFETLTCTESWYDASIQSSIESDRQPFQVRDCSQDKDSAPKTGYTVIDNRVYRGGSSRHRYSPCQGTGVGSVGEVLNPVCWMPSWLQTHETVEHRDYWLVSEDAAHFRIVPPAQPSSAEGRQRGAGAYAMDSESVYLGTEKIEGADPATFEVYFPTDSAAKLERYSFARDKNHLFIDEWALPLIDLERVEWLGVICTGEGTECRNSAYAKPQVAKVGTDILFLDNGARPTVFRDLATSLITFSREGFTTYCAVAGRHYRIEFGIMKEAKLVLQSGG